MYIVVNSLKRNLGFKGIEINDLLIGVPIIFICIVLFIFTTFKIGALVLFMIGIFMLLPISVSKKNRMYKVIALMFKYLFRKKTYIYSKEDLQKGKVISFGNK
ncbi:MAG: hypothetical protein IJY25_03915 [Bacilli bacterium]|nr:hypothetical protein [Bacilli bacterium]MBQ9072280.1 hypothetical protein [Bacilli bacterium]